MNLLPAFLVRRFAHRQNLLKIAENLGWLLFDRILRMGGGLLMGIWMARYLGPGQFGELNYAMAFVALFSAAATLGLNTVAVRDLIRNPEEAEQILGTAFIVRVCGSLVAFASALGVIALLRPEGELGRSAVTIVAFGLLFQPAEVCKNWFEAQVQSRYFVWVENGAFLIMAVTRVALIVLGASLVGFALAVLGETILVATGLLLIYARKVRSPFQWSRSSIRARTLLRDSWPFALASLSLIINMRIDQVMLGQMVGGGEVGIYSAATRISEIWYFIPTAVVASVFPSIAQLPLNSDAQAQRWQYLYRLMIWLAVVAAIVTTLLSSWIVQLLYGDKYLAAAGVLTIHVWAGINVAIGCVWSQWLLLENKSWVVMVGHLSGAVINCGLNYLLIPVHGAYGAAIATLLSYWISAILSYALHKPMVTLLYLVRSIVPYRFDMQPK